MHTPYACQAQTNGIGSTLKVKVNVKVECTGTDDELCNLAECLRFHDIIHLHVI